MSLWQIRQEVGQAKVGRHLQAWQRLIPILAAFWIAFGAILMLSGFLFLAVSALAVIAAFSVVVIVLAWAYQNDR